MQVVMGSSGVQISSLRYVETHCVSSGVSSVCPGPYQILTVMLSLAVLREKKEDDDDDDEEEKELKQFSFCFVIFSVDRDFFGGE